MNVAWNRGLVPALIALGLGGGPALAGAPLALQGASAEELAGLEHVDPALARAVVDFRTARGGLDTVEELRLVPGMTPQALTALRGGTVLEFEMAVTRTGSLETVEDVLAQFEGEPAVGVVQTWASQHASLEPETVARWLKASRSFAGLPQLRLEYRYSTDFDNDFVRLDGSGAPPTSLDVQTFDIQTDASVGGDQTALVRATWDLNELVMSSEQIRVINEAQDVVKLREKVLGEVTRLYYERRRLQVDVLLDPKLDLMGQVRDELRLRELTAQLDAFTGGRFSAALD